MEQKNETSPGFLRNWKVGLTIIVVSLLAVVFVWFQLKDKPTANGQADSMDSANISVPTSDSIQEDAVLPTGTIEPGASDELAGISTTTNPTAEDDENVGPNTTLAPPPIPTMTEKEVEVVNSIDQTKINTTSVEDCDRIFDGYPWCGVVSSALQVTQPEWEDLFPRAEFYVVRRMLFGGEFPEQRNLLVIKQDDQTLSLDPGRAFEQLININEIVTTEENRETISRALVLMYLPDYLESTIEFSDWRGGNWPAPGRGDYNYAINVQTSIKRWQFSWFFWFYEEQLITAQGRVVLDEEVGFQEDDIYPPSKDILTYWRK